MAITGSSHWNNCEFIANTGRLRSNTCVFTLEYSQIHHKYGEFALEYFRIYHEYWDFVLDCATALLFITFFAETYFFATCFGTDLFTVVERSKAMTHVKLLLSKA